MNTYTCLSYLLVTLLCVGDTRPVFSQSRPLDLSAVLILNDQSIRATHSLAAEIKLMLVDGEKLYPGSDLYWYFQGDCQRLRLKVYKLNLSGELIVNVDDTANSHDNCYQLTNYNFDDPPSLSLTVDRPGAGRIGPRVDPDDIFSVDPRIYLLHAIHTPKSPKQFQSLKELVGNVSNARLTRSPEGVEGEYEIEIPGDRMIRARCDPKRGFMTTKIEVFTASPNDCQLEYRLEVTDFRNYGNGVFLPTEVKRTVRVGNTEKVIVKTAVNYISVNQPIPESEFKIVFPDWLRISEVSTGKVMIADGQGGYRYEFDSLREYLDWWDAQLNSSNPKRRLSNRVVTALIITLSILIALTVILLRRRRRIPSPKEEVQTQPRPSP